MSSEKMASAIRKRFTSLQNDHSTIFEDAERYRAMYRCRMEESDDYPWEYQLTDPQIFPTIRAHLARLNPAEARVKLSGQNPNRDVNQKVVNWELNEILITQILYKIMYSGFMSGRGYVKSGWFYKPALKVKSDTKEVIMRSIQNRADAVFVRFNDLFVPNRNIPELDAQPYTIERISRRYGDLLDENKITERWDNDLLKKIGEKKMFDREIDYGVDLPLEDEYTGEDKYDEALKRSQYVSLLCMYTIDGGEYWMLEKGTDGLLNKNQENYYWHGHSSYIDFCPFPEDDEYFSMGIPHTIEDLEVALSSTLNQLLTNGRKAGNSMWLVGPSGKDVADYMFTDRPNGIVRVTGNLSDYQRLDFNTAASGEILKLRTELQTTAERTTGISSLYASGAASSPQVNKTATGARIIDENIDQNLQLLISLFGAQVLKKLGEHFLELNQQFITEEQTFEITGKHGQDDEYVMVKPQQISADFKVKASPERMLRTSPAVKLASLQNTIDTLANQKNVQTNMKPLYEELIAETPGLEDIDESTIIIDPEQKAEEVIKAIMSGYPAPESKWDDDHKALMAIIQKHLIEMQEHPPEMMEQFYNYLSELKRWIEAKNMNLVVQPPPQPQLQPTDPAALAQSMGVGGGMPALPTVNPTQGMAAPLSQDQLGMTPSLSA